MSRRMRTSARSHLMVMVVALTLLAASTRPVPAGFREYLSDARDPTDAYMSQQMAPSIDSMRRTRVHFRIEHAGQVYDAWMVEDTSIPVPASGDLEVSMRWCYLRHNWLILDGAGALVEDDTLYARLAKGAEWAQSLASDGPWSPEGLRSAADTNDQIRLLSSGADFLTLWIMYLSAAVKSLIPLAWPAAAPAYSAGAVDLADKMCSIYNQGGTFDKVAMDAYARVNLQNGSIWLRNAAVSIEPIAAQLIPVYPYYDTPIPLATLEQYYNSVKMGWEDSYAGRWDLAHSSDVEVMTYLFSLAAKLTPGGDCSKNLVPVIMGAVGLSPHVTESIEDGAFKSEQFRLTEEEVQEGALAYKELFSTYGVPDESGIVSPVTQLSQPSITPGPVGDASTTFTFSIDYRNLNNHAPSYVRLSLNGLPVGMSKADPSDQNYADGAIYTWSSKLNAGHYYYYFEACDNTPCDQSHVVEAGFLGNFHLEIRPLPDPVLTADPEWVPLDGVSASTITVIVRDSQGNPVAGQEVWFDADKSFTFSPGSTTTDDDGVATTQFRPDELGDTTVTAVIGGLGSGHIAVNAYPASGSYRIQLSAQAVQSTSTYKQYQLDAYVTYASTGETVSGKTITFQTNLGTFQNGSQQISRSIDNGQFYPYDPPVLTVTSSGSVAIVGAVETSSASMSFDVVLGAPTVIYPAVTVGGVGIYENDHELSWTPDGRLLATVCQYQGCVWNTLTWEQAASLECEGNGPRAVEFSPSGRFLAAANNNHYISIFRTSDWAATLCMEKSGSYNQSISWSDDETMLAVIAGKYTIEILNASNGSTIRTLTVPASDPSHGTEWLFALDWQGNRLAAGGETGIAYIWDTTSWSPPMSRDLLFRSIESVKWSPSGAYVAFVGHGLSPENSNDVAFLDSSGGLVRQVDPGTETVESVDWSPDGSKVVINDDGAGVKVIDMSGNVLMILQNGGQYSAAWSPTGLVAVAGANVPVYAPYDTSGPSVTFDSPDNGFATADSSIMARGNVYDPSGIKSVGIRVNGGASSPLSIASDGTFESTVPLQEGNNTIEVLATDIVDHAGDNTVSVNRLYDQMPPIISNPQVRPPSGTLGTVLTLSCSIVDSWSGVDPTSVEARIQSPDETDVAIVRLYDDGVHGGDAAAGDGRFTGEWYAISAGEANYLVDIIASDIRGKSRELENGLWLQIYDLPAISAVSQFPYTPTELATVVVSATITDTSGVAVATLRYSADGGTTWVPRNMAFDSTAHCYRATVGPQRVGSVIYLIEAVDSLNHFSTTGLFTYTILPDPSIRRIYLPIILR